MRQSVKNEKKQNQGFSVITVIVAVAFIGIMAMTVLYTSMANFRMKATDLKAKDSFYTAENALDEIRAGLQEEVGEAMSDAYVQVLENYNLVKTDGSGSSSVEGLDQLRQDKFRELYIRKLKERLRTNDSENRYDMAKLRGFVDMKGRLPEREHIKIVTPRNKYPDMVEDMANPGVILKNLKVIHTDAGGRAAVIETNIRLGMPKVNFPTPSTLPDLMNMIVVADDGIVFGEEKNTAENGNKPIKIKGSIYAGYKNKAENTGTSISILGNQQVTVENGERLVCLGDILVADHGSFLNTGGTDVWAQGISVTSGTVELTGRTYLADDLTLNTTVNTGMGSSVKISGEYYGYGSRDTAKESHFNDNKYKDKTPTALDSAIIINGRGSTLDLSGVSRMMLAGNSYIGSSNLGAINGKTNSDVMTGEGLSVKGNQLAYLVDPECFRDEEKGYTNPMPSDQYTSFTDDDTLFDYQKPVKAWGGKSMSVLGLDDANPVQKVLYPGVGGEGIVYFYLNFSSSEKASAFFEEYYNSKEIKANMDRYLNFYMGENQGITMKNKGDFLRFVTRGNILTYNGGDGTNGQGNLVPATDAQMKENVKRQQVDFQNMWYALNRKMISSYALLHEKVYTGEGENKILDHNEKDPNRYVYDNLVNEKELKKFLASQGAAGGRFSHEASQEGQKLRAWVVDNAHGTPFRIDGTTGADQTRLVVATGDVIIGEGVEYQGIIMAGGSLTMKPGSGLLSAPLEAAKVFQSLREKVGENDEKADFFWEGDKYVLGNSLTDYDDTGAAVEKDVYDLAECITYHEWKKK